MFPCKDYLCDKNLIMARIIENYSLKSLNSFGVEARTAKYIQFTRQEEILDFFRSENNEACLILGEGSNILFREDYKGIIIHPKLKGVEILKETEQDVQIKVQCGENWDELVAYCVAQNWSGIENLSLIPGSVGSAPVQNIGAYGVEVKDRILWVEGIETENPGITKIHNPECKFGYRQSIFKNELKGKFLITSVVFQLFKQARFELGYGPVSELFQSKKEQNLNALRETIIEIRESKLPDPNKTGNAGSFFKNPVISLENFTRLKNRFANIPSYPSGNEIKIPAAWLIEKSGWKGVREGDVGTWPNQPLVIVNYGNAKGQQIFEFSEKIQKGVEEMFGILLEREVNVV